ncbi:MAG: hypothetical protein AAGA29_00365 [Planctomycetota bacterium]
MHHGVSIAARELEQLEPRRLFSATIPSVLAGHLEVWEAGDAHEIHADLHDDGHDHAHTEGHVHGDGHTSPLPPLNTVDPPSGAARSSGAFALSQVPVLHSNPGSDHSVYLDFNGMTVSGTVWNTTHHSGNPIHAPAFDLDGDIDTFSQQEIDQMVEVWQRVAEDFAPFDLDVTTEEPPTHHFTQGSRAIRVLISSNVDHAELGGDGTDWYEDAGGVARIGSWRYASDTPAWVFSNLLQGSAKNVAEAVSHETGHTMGLFHDGILNGEEYFAGHGSGATSWAPIMGSSYTNQVTQWSRGEYDDADNAQDDLAVITHIGNGFTYRVDDHADSRAGASAIEPLFGGRSIGAAGIITTSSDVDYFTFETAAGPVEIDINPAAVGPNLDIKARLYDADGDVVATSDPSAQLAAGFALTLDAGRYYLSVEGTGAGDPGDSGYSDYGSLGQYHLVGSIQPAAPLTLPAPPPGDVNGDFTVGADDLSLITAAWGQSGVGLPEDVNDDGMVGIADLDLVLAQWGAEAALPTDGLSRVHVPTDGSLGLGWVQPGFDDSVWGIALPAVGYETSGSDFGALIETELPAGTLGAYLRTGFEADGPAGLDGMGLTIRYDDGFVAYLNGVEVASHQTPDDPAWDDRATDAHDDADAKRFAWFDLSQHLSLLVDGPNTLAVHVMNASSSSSDLLLDAELVTWSAFGGGASAALPLGDEGGGETPLTPAAAAPVSTQRPAVAAWMKGRTGKPADALARPAADPAGPQRGIATMPRRVIDLLR